MIADVPVFLNDTLCVPDVVLKAKLPKTTVVGVAVTCAEAKVAENRQTNVSQIRIAG